MHDALQVAAVCDHWRQPAQNGAEQSSASPGPQLPFWLLTKDADAQWQTAPLAAFRDVSTKTIFAMLWQLITSDHNACAVQKWSIQFEEHSCTSGQLRVLQEVYFARNMHEQDCTTQRVIMAFLSAMRIHVCACSSSRKQRDLQKLCR